jgi:hypothetical protein
MRNPLQPSVLAMCLVGGVAGLALECCLDFSQCTWCGDGGSDGGCAPNIWNTELGSYPPNTCAVVDSGLVNGAGAGEFSCDAGAVSAGTQFLNLAVGSEICAHANVLAAGNGGKLEVGCFACPADAGTCKCSQESGCVVSTTDFGPQTVGPFRIPPLNCQTLNVFFQLTNTTGGLLQFTDAWVWQQPGDGGCAWDAAASCPTP